GEIVADEALQEPHQLADLGGGPAPVLGRKTIDRQVADTKLSRGTHGAAQRFDAAAMTFHARQAAARRPAAVAIHDDRHVIGRDRSTARVGRRYLWQGAVSRGAHRTPITGRQTCMISFSLLA